jgi:hypothetical protein
VRQAKQTLLRRGYYTACLNDHDAGWKFLLRGAFGLPALLPLDYSDIDLPDLISLRVTGFRSAVEQKRAGCARESAWALKSYRF